MSRARQLWEAEKVPAHRLQFRATFMVCAHLAHYHTWHLHKNAVLKVLQARQK